MKIFLAGAMSNQPHFNFPRFHAAAVSLRAQGHKVFNPAEFDVREYGEGFAGDNPTGDVEQAMRDYGFDMRKTFARNTHWICLNAEAIALLPGWADSRGAIAERALALALGLQVMIL